MEADPDRVKGAIYGQAIGEALGVQTEGNDNYHIVHTQFAEKKLDLPYSGTFKGNQTNDWSDATDNAVLVMRSLVSYFGGETEDPAADLALRINNWKRGGFLELGDTKGACIEGIISRASAAANWLINPVEAAKTLKGYLATNGAMIRVAPCAVTINPAGWAIAYSEVTHADEHSQAAAVFMATLLGDLCRGKVATPALVCNAAGEARNVVAAEEKKKSLMEAITKTKKLADLKLDDRESQTYASKTLGAAVWAYRQLVATPEDGRTPEFFKKVITEIVLRGGDSSSNAAMAGAILGASMGTEKLPKDWFESLPNREWLKNETENFLEAAERVARADEEAAQEET